MGNTIEKQDDITKLEFPLCVKSRPGMFIGSTENPSILLREIIDNSVDECYKSKNCNKIIIYNKDDRATIIDNGRGIPIKKMPSKMWVPSVKELREVTMAYSSIFDLNSGSKFNKTENLQGMNGVGSSCCNALSSEYNLIVKIDESRIKDSTDYVKNLWSKIESNKSNKWYYHIISNGGVLKSESIISYEEIFDLIPGLDRSLIDKMDIGTLVSFIPDKDIFDTIKMSNPTTLMYFKYICEKIYKKNVDIYINGEEYDRYFTPYKYEVVSTINSIIPESKNAQATFLYSFNFDEDFNSYSNVGSINGLIVNQGHHINLSTYAFKEAFARMFPGHDYRNNELKGINFATICLCPEPSFSSQTKERCSGIPGINYNCLEPLIKLLCKLMKDNYDAFKLHQEKVIEYNMMTQNLSKIELIKSKIPIIAEVGSRRAAQMKPIKLCDCTTKNREEAELYICEGSSAAGSFKKARNPKTHAVMELRGKPKNSAPCSIEEILNNAEMRDIISAIGTGVDDYFNLDKIRYGKIIISSDADPDGANIASLVLGLFFSHMKYLIRAGRVYVEESPLYFQNGKYYFYGEEDKLDTSKPIKRFKGLGELNTNEVKTTLLDPKTRRLCRITEDGMNEAIRLITTTSARKKLMIESGFVNEVIKLSKKEVK